MIQAPTVNVHLLSVGNLEAESCTKPSFTITMALSESIWRSGVLTIPCFMMMLSY